MFVNTFMKNKSGTINKSSIRNRYAFKIFSFSFITLRVILIFVRITRSLNEIQKEFTEVIKNYKGYIERMNVQTISSFRIVENLLLKW